MFDLLHHGRDSLLDQPYTERRERLEELGLNADPVRTPPWRRGGAAGVLADSIAQGLEGVVGKPLASTYHPGQRRDWIKNVKHQEVIACGWKPGAGRRTDMIGSLLLGVYDGGQLRYTGHVGTGFTQDMLAELARAADRQGPHERPCPKYPPDRPRAVADVVETWWRPGGDRVDITRPGRPPPGLRPGSSRRPTRLPPPGP